ncbi:hypothetical protein [Actinoplanes sp. L3-i22]|uniref:hypothetical protein n=1 Tax=Actinoplanes sp. L3-i22 TaxID=2836373 RepID=UPI001C766BA8|nr:hypothetical protein [Actinoplanes sp. L3-i22]BCY10921.1 hypothetical protein L3i22_060090 [Actinoplanes sp. L3-i22]
MSVPKRKPEKPRRSKDDWWDDPKTSRTGNDAPATPVVDDSPATPAGTGGPASAIPDDALLWVLFIGLMITVQLVTSLVAGPLDQPWSSIVIVAGYALALLPLAWWRLRRARRPRPERDEHRR